MIIIDEQLAAEIGLQQAIMLTKIYAWVEHNSRNGRNMHDGQYWTYNSARAWNLELPFLSVEKIKYALKQLETAEYIRAGRYNAEKYDRTKWYTVTMKGRELIAKCQERSAENVRSPKNHRCISGFSAIDCEKTNNASADFPQCIGGYSLTNTKVTTQNNNNNNNNTKRSLPPQLAAAEEAIKMLENENREKNE